MQYYTVLQSKSANLNLHWELPGPQISVKTISLTVLSEKEVI